jgi:WD40 repeat protein
MIALVLLVCGAAPPAQGDPSLPKGAISRLGLPALPADLAVRSLQGMAFWPDGKVLATATREGVRLWHLSTRRWQRLIRSPEMGSSTVLLDAKGKTALFVARDGDRMHAYDLLRSKPLVQIKTEFRMMAVAISADGSTVARAEDNGASITVRAWEAASGKEKIRFYLRSYAAKKVTMALSPDGKLLAAVLEDGNAGVLYSGLVRTTNCLEVESLGDLPVQCLAFAPDGKRLAVVRDGSISLHSGRSGRPIKDIIQKGLRAESVAFSPDGRHLALGSAGGGDKKVDLLELASGKVRMTAKAMGSDGASSLAFSPGGGRLVMHEKGSKALIFDVAGRRSLAGGVSPDTLSGLASRSGDKGQRAFAQLMSSPRQAVALLRKHVRPAKAPLSDEKIKQLIALADDADPALSAKAKKALADAGHLALSQLRVMRSLTTDKNIRAGLDRLISEAGNPVARKTLVQLRAVEALEKLRTPEARKLLRELALRSYADSELSDAAWAALDRLEKRK